MDEETRKEISSIKKHQRDADLKSRLERRRVDCLKDHVEQFLPLLTEIAKGKRVKTEIYKKIVENLFVWVFIILIGWLGAASWWYFIYLAKPAFTG